MLSKTEMTKAEKFNLYATIGGPILLSIIIGGVAWMFNAKLTIMAQDMDRKNADTYVAKIWFEKSHDDTTKQLDKISDNVSTLQQSVSEIKGELTKQQPSK